MFHPSPEKARRAFAVLSLSALPLSCAQAQDEPQYGPAGGVELAPIVISATRLPTPEDQLGSSVTVIGADQIDAIQARTLPDALQYAPGLNLVQTGGPGGLASIYMRGTNSNQTKVLIDGIDASDPSSADGSFDFSQLLAAQIQQIEVLRGPQSGLYGADAVGGVIETVTRKGSGPPTLSASLEGGSFSTFNQSVGVGGGSTDFDYTLDFTHFHAGDTMVTPLNLVPAGRTPNPDYDDNRTWSTRLDGHVLDNLDLGLVARYVETRLRSTSDDFLGPEAARSDSDNQELFTRGTGHWTLFGGILDQTFGVGYTQYHRLFLDPNVAPPDPATYRGDRVKLDWQGDLRLAEGETLTLGAEHELDEIDDSAPVVASISNDAGYAQLQSKLDGRWFNTASLRYDSNARYGSKATYREAPSVLFPDWGFRLKGSVGTGFKPPTLDELYDSYPAYDFFANPNLKPETSLGYDAGFEESLLERQVEFGATYFHNDIRNLIDINDTYTSYINVGRATTRGVEGFAAYKPSDRLGFRADYTWTSAQDDLQHVPLLRRPRNKATLEALWQVSQPFSLTATLLYVGPRYDVNRAGTVTDILTDGYTVLNLAGAYDLGHGVTGFARIDNLLDRRYQDPIGFQHPGLGVFAGVRVAIEAAHL